jgi:hypothetical protein
MQPLRPDMLIYSYLPHGPLTGKIKTLENASTAEVFEASFAHFLTS